MQWHCLHPQQILVVWLQCPGGKASPCVLDYIWDVAFYDDKFYGLTREWNIVVLEHITAEFEKLDMDRRQSPKWPVVFLNSLFVCQGEIFLITASEPKCFQW